MSEPVAGPLAQKTAVVTGASRGIGKAIALELARQGANLVVCARTEEVDPNLPGTIRQTADEISALGAQVLALRVDVASDDDLHAMVDRALEAFGRIDILVNNAAYRSRGTFLASSIAELDRALQANVHAIYLASQLVVPSMIAAGGGAIFGITSGAARADGGGGQRWQGHPAYAITKAALDRFTTAVAAELFDQNVAVIAIAPGRTITELGRMRLAPGVEPEGNRPEDTAQVLATIAREPMRYTGQIIETSLFKQQFEQHV